MSTVIRTQTWEAAPGKQAEMVALMRAAVPLFERHGVRVRILNNAVSGADGNTFSFVQEDPNMTAFGAAGEKLVADPEIAAHMAKVDAALVGRVVSNTLSLEVPIQ